MSQILSIQDPTYVFASLDTIEKHSGKHYLLKWIGFVANT